MTKADAVISNRFKHKTPSLYPEKWGPLIITYALPLVWVEANILKYIVFFADLD
jgi:hypothetical protein